MKPSAEPALGAAVRPDGPVLLFDGECGLCQRIVRLLLRLDRSARLRFAALQGAPAQAFLRQHGLPTEELDSLVFVPAWGRRDQPGHRLRTDGVIAALREIDGAGPQLLADGLALLPKRFRDGGYRWIARHRQRIFGPWRDRPLPRREWAARFID